MERTLYGRNMSALLRPPSLRRHSHPRVPWSKGSYARRSREAARLLLISLCITAGTGARVAAHKSYAPGITDTEIRVGQTMSHSGPASAWGANRHHFRRLFQRSDRPSMGR